MIPRPPHWQNIWSPISKRRIIVMNWSLSVNRWTVTSTTNIYHWCLWWQLTRENPASCWRYSRGYQTGPESGKWNWSYLYLSSCTSLPKVSRQTSLTDSKIWFGGLQLHIDAHEKSPGIHRGDIRPGHPIKHIGFNLPQIHGAHGPVPYLPPNNGSPFELLHWKTMTNQGL